MSIKSQIDRISDEVETQTDLISQIKTALNGKRAGSGLTIESTDGATVSGETLIL